MRGGSDIGRDIDKHARVKFDVERFVMGYGIDFGVESVEKYDGRGIRLIASACILLPKFELDCRIETGKDHGTTILEFFVFMSEVCQTTR